MPRPTSVQLIYGSVTVILSTLSMLLLTQTRAVYGIVLISVVAVALGLLVAANTPVRPAAALSKRDRARYPGRARGAESRAQQPSLR